jgi:LmeA-like phospholipid-binding
LNPQPLSSKSQGIISSLLAPACAAWLRTQVSEVASLDVQIAAKDRQILSGTIPAVSILATKTVYRGISLQKIKLLADQIEVNLRQVMRGKPLRVLQPIEVEIEATIADADLLSSLTAPLLSGAVNQLIAQVIALPFDKLRATPDEDWSLVWQSVQIETDKLTLQGTIQQVNGSIPIQICTGIKLLEGRIIHLAPLAIDCELVDKPVESYSIDLGDEVNLRKLLLGEGELHCAGQVRIRP